MNPSHRMKRAMSVESVDIELTKTNWESASGKMRGGAERKSQG